MSEFRTEKRILPSANFHGESSLPVLEGAWKKDEDYNTFGISLDEDDGLFVDFGPTDNGFPYRMQDTYDRELNDREYNFIVLENENLRASFAPDFGGKLWSLYDKKKGRELMFSNSCIRPCNLAIRNAWMSGGVEWNFGYRGHHPHTCSLINTAKTHLDDGTPVLRFYYFERIKKCVVQMDFFLPDGSAFLFARMRLTNPNKTTIPAYWWSNIAVEQKKGDRVIVPAVETYSTGAKGVQKFSIPYHKGTDISYPENSPVAFDYFWKTFHNYRHYVAQLDTNGYGLCQTSTSRLVGRKMFVWGNSQGGSRWANFLTKDSENGLYDEIQCGLAHTQYECLPMPPKTVWEWCEAYGAMTADSNKVHGTWDEARAEVENVFDTMLTTDDLEKLLSDTRKMAKSPADEIIYRMEGWGKLEQMYFEKYGGDSTIMCPQLDFGEISDNQKPWLSLLNDGTVGEHDVSEVPSSYMKDVKWIHLLEKAVNEKDKDNWYAHYLLGTAYIIEYRYQDAINELNTSISLSENCWAYYALSHAYGYLGEPDSQLKAIMKSYRLSGNDISIAKKVFSLLKSTKKFDELISFYENACAEVKENKRCMLYYATALCEIGDADMAEKILCGEDGKTFLVVPDIQEGEQSVTGLWIEIKKKQGMPAEEAAASVPYPLDFRMQAAVRNWAD